MDMIYVKRDCPDCIAPNFIYDIKTLLINKCRVCGSELNDKMPFYDIDTFMDEYFPQGTPDVIPLKCDYCDYFKKTGWFDQHKGYCDFFKGKTYSSWKCVVTLIENEFEKIDWGKSIKVQDIECPNCNKPQNDNAIFCKDCGTEISPKELATIAYCDKCKNTYSDDFTFCEKDGNKLKSIEVEEGSEFQVSDIKSEELDEEIVETVTSDADEELPMKWYKFVTYVMCPFVIIGMIVLILGLSDYVDDIVTFSLLFDCLLTGTLMFGLHNKTAWSWKLLLGLYILNSLFGRIEALDEWGPFVYLIFVIIVNAFTTYPNYIYFNKRKHLFVN